MIDYAGARHPYNVAPMHAAIERMIGIALVDKALARALISNPRATALSCGIDAEDAEKLADIRAKDLQSFVRALQPRIYRPARAQRELRHATGT